MGNENNPVGPENLDKVIGSGNWHTTVVLMHAQFVVHASQQ